MPRNLSISLSLKKYKIHLVRTTTNRPVRKNAKTSENMKPIDKIKTLTEDYDYVIKNKSDIVKKYNEASLQISNLNSKRGSLWVRSKLLTPKKSTTMSLLLRIWTLQFQKEVSLPFLDLQDVAKRLFFVWLQVSTVSKAENFTSMIQNQ